MGKDFLQGIMESILVIYWQIIENFAKLQDAYSNVAGASWLQKVCNNLENICTTKLMPAFSGVAIAVAVTYFLISIIGLVTEDRFTPEFLAKFFAKLVISIAVILWSDKILIGIVDFGDAMGNMFVDWSVNDFLPNNKGINEAFDEFSNALMKAVERETDFNIEGEAGVENLNGNGYRLLMGFKWYENDSDKGMFWCIAKGVAVLISGALLSVLSLIVVPIMNAIVYFVEISRNLELYIRGSLIPIAAGVMADDGWRGAGGRYIKKILALATQKVVLSLTCIMTAAMVMNYIFDELTAAAGNDISAFMSESFSILITAIVICVAGFSFMFKSLQVVNDLWGAS